MLSQLFEDLTLFLQQVLLSGGIPGIVVIAFMENIFPPTPSEFLYPLAGKLVYDGDFNFVMVVLAGIGGSLVGAMVFYQLGRSLGAERTRAFIDRYGTLKVGRWRMTIFTVEAYDQAAAQFEKRGGIIVMVARSVPLIHGVISIPAGVVAMPRGKFLLYSFLGVAAWITPTVLLGYWLGGEWEQVLNLLDVYEGLWYGLFAVGLAYWWLKRRRQRHAGV